jgi:hypothetical protein
MFGTWNVNGKMPEALDGWLRTDGPPPDLYAIGYRPFYLFIYFAHKIKCF